MIFTPASTRSSATLCAALARHGEDAYHDLLILDCALELRVRAHRQLADPLADLAVVGVEDRDDPEAVVGEDVRPGDRAAQMPGAEEGDVVLAGGAEDLADLHDQRVDVVAHPRAFRTCRSRTGRGGSASS